ncbi:MAG: hypothetical protein LBH43_08120 [Treponema sp.]|jgi:hypothetical protein|nr:hypothetical protein [Treponema sp.]
MTTQEKSLYTIIPLEEFKSLLGIDDREDKLARFSLVTSTFTIEQYCKRKLLPKKYFEIIGFFGDLLLPLKEYPVTKVLASFSIGYRDLGLGTGGILETEFYRVIPDCGTDIDIPFSLELSPAVARLGCKAIKVIYWAGYSINKIPADLSAACLELASWNLNRYKGRRVGMTGNIRGAGKEGEHFEMSMPENVKQLLEPYRRKTI